jgi:hypothetical protein
VLVLDPVQNFLAKLFLLLYFQVKSLDNAARPPCETLVGIFVQTEALELLLILHFTDALV